jgi:hypothetical protein
MRRRSRFSAPADPHPDRRALERRGCRTLLDYREDHIRDADGQLLVVIPRWTAEAELPDGRVLTASVSSPAPGDVWSRLREVARV